MEGYKIRDQLRYNVVYSGLSFVGGSNSPAIGTVAIKIANSTAPDGLSADESRLFIEKYSGSLVIADVDYDVSDGSWSSNISVYKWPAYPAQVLYQNGDHLSLNWPAFVSGDDTFVNFFKEDRNSAYTENQPDDLIYVMASLMTNIVIPAQYNRK